MVKRASDRDMVPFDRACELIERMRDRFYNELPPEEASIASSLCRRLSDDVAAMARSPSFNISTMDGYALNAGDEYPLKIIGEVFAGEGLRTLGRGEAVYITTGAVVPDGADAVLKVEDASVEGGALNGPRLEPWTNVIRAGADFGKGEVILKKGTLFPLRPYASSTPPPSRRSTYIKKPAWGCYPRATR
jgi:molybdopterin biosynthesis enzyme